MCETGARILSCYFMRVYATSTQNDAEFEYDMVLTNCKRVYMYVYLKLCVLTLKVDFLKYFKWE